MDQYRKHERVAVDIAVTLSAVLGVHDARIVDLSPSGARIVGTTLPKGARFQIEYPGQTLFAHCIWSEVDRLGARFPFLLTEGPLYDIMMMAGVTNADDRMNASCQHIGARCVTKGQTTARSMAPSRRAPTAVFGRRPL